MFGKCTVAVPDFVIIGTSREWWETSAPYTATRIYRCSLTGTADDREDAELPVSSFQYRLYANGRAYISAVIPDAVTYTPVVTSRPNGTLILLQGYRYVDGSEQLSEMARSQLSGFRYDTGARSSSLTLTGSETVTFSFDPGVEKTVHAVTVDILQEDGKRKIRTEPIFGLYPGDVFRYAGAYYKAEFISVAVGDRMSQMEITYTDVAGTRYDLKTNTNTGIAGF